MRRVAITSSASGNGKTTLGRELARRLGVPFVEADALAYGANWVETPADELRARIEPIVASDAWVIDGTYRGKLGDLILRRADVVVWLDLPIRVWLPRLVRRSIRRVVGGDALWHGNRESWRSAFGGRRSLIGGALRGHFSRRRRYPTLLAPYPVVRLRTEREVRDWLATIPSPDSRAQGVALRRARAEDSEALRALTVRSMAHWPRDAAYLAEAERLMSLDAEGLARDEAWVAERDGATLGYYRVSTHGEVAEIEELFVEPEWIGRGIGRTLFEHAAGRARAVGARRLEWDTEANAIGFYRAMGGREIGTRPSAIAWNEPLARMRLDLAPE